MLPTTLRLWIRHHRLLHVALLVVGLSRQCESCDTSASGTGRRGTACCEGTPRGTESLGRALALAWPVCGQWRLTGSRERLRVDLLAPALRDSTGRCLDVAA